jgi:hypothetical protein
MLTALLLLAALLAGAFGEVVAALGVVLGLAGLGLLGVALAAMVRR